MKNIQIYENKTIMQYVYAQSCYRLFINLAVVSLPKYRYLYHPRDTSILKYNVVVFHQEGLFQKTSAAVFGFFNNRMRRESVQ
jgi:hypothetical protein